MLERFLFPTWRISAGVDGGMKRFQSSLTHKFNHTSFHRTRGVMDVAGGITDCRRLVVKEKVEGGSRWGRVGRVELG